MIKELILAIALGSILGFGVTGAYFALNKNKGAPQDTNQISPIPTISEEELSTEVSTTSLVSSQETSINITSPENNSVVSTSKVTIKGDSKPNSLIVISTSSKNFNTKTNSDGVFSLNIELDVGMNLIKISSFDPEDNQDEIEFKLTYSTAKI